MIDQSERDRRRVAKLTRDNFAPMTRYIVTVWYRTNSGCNGKRYEIEAADMTTAISIACDKQRKRRGVIRIDGGDCVIDRYSYCEFSVP